MQNAASERVSGRVGVFKSAFGETEMDLNEERLVHL